MPIEAKVYRVLIASPRDIAEERNIIRDQINRWNAIHTLDMRIVLMPVGWESDATPTLKERGQAVINRQLVDTCDLLIGIFWARLGTPTPEAESGTVEEIERANNEGKRCIVYFSDRGISPSKTDPKQQKRLQKYKERLQPQGLTDSYSTLEEFKEKVFRHITSAVLQITREEKERRAAEHEAKLTEQAIGLPVQTITNTSSTEIAFNTLSEAQTSIKRLLESSFSVQDMEDAKEQEIARIQSTLTSPDLAELFSRQPTTETISAITQILETATTPSIYAIAAIGRYADENSPEWLDLAGDWIERLSTRKVEGYEWASYIKTYPGLILLYALGISSLRAGKINFLNEVSCREIYLREYEVEDFLLHMIDPRRVFYHSISGMIEPGFERKHTPVSDHLAPLMKNKLYPSEQMDRYLDWFDLLEFLMSFKAVQQMNEYPYFGSFTWRWETNRFIFKMLQDAAIEQGRYGSTISSFLGGSDALEKTALMYDKIASQSQTDFGRNAPINYTNHLISLAKQGRKVSSYRQLIKIINPNK